MRVTGTVIIGAGQAGLATSYELTAVGAEHVVLERDRIGARWHERWESLRLLTPNWLNQLPGTAPHSDQGGFLRGREFARQLAEYAESFGAPVEEGVAVVGLRRAPGGFHVSTTAEDWHARNVVLATGDCDVPRLPALAGQLPAAIEQLHTSEYRSPGQLSDGGVLVVGAGASGLQIALELRESGHEVTIATGRHNRMIRTFGGRDIWEWLVDAGHIDVTIDEVRDAAAARRANSFGLAGGRDIDLGVLSRAGVGVAGRLTRFEGGRPRFADDLAGNLEESDRAMRKLLGRIGCDPDAVPPVSVDADPRGHAAPRTVLWATGFRREYPWLELPVLSADGEIVQHHGVTPVPGLYTVGLRFQRKRKSHFVGGVGEDARLLAARISATSATTRDAGLRVAA